MSDPTTQAGRALLESLRNGHPTTAVLLGAIAAIENEAAAAARAALLDEPEVAVRGWPGWMVHKGIVLREIKKQRRP